MKTESGLSVIASGAAALAGFGLLIAALTFEPAPAGNWPAFGTPLTAEQWALIDEIENEYNHNHEDTDQ
jgi:hypothetical protein